MATTEVYLSGKAKWAKVYKPDEKYRNWTINLYLDDDSLKKYKASGMSMAFKEDDDGSFVTFRRPEAKLIKNEMVKFTPPKVVNKDGEPISDNIGNGSDVTIKVIVYDTVKGPGHRLEAVRIDKLVEYAGKKEASTLDLVGVPF